MTIEVLMGRTLEPSVEEVMAAIQQKTTTAAIAKDISDPNGNFSTSMYANTDGNRGGYCESFRGRGRGGRYQHYRKYCHHCKTTNHNTKDCRKAPSDSTSSSTPSTNDSRTRNKNVAPQTGACESHSITDTLRHPGFNSDHWHCLQQWPRHMQHLHPSQT